MRSFEFYQNAVRQDLELAYLQYKKGQRSVGELAGEIVSGETSKREKLRALFCLFREIIPGSVSSEESFKKRFFDLDQLPFSPDMFDFKNEIGNGGESEVFLLKSKDESVPSYAIKFDRSTSRRKEDLLARLEQIREDYEKIKDWYQDIPGIVPDELMIITHGLRKGKRSVVVLQRFFSGEIRDVFNDLNRDELVRLLENDPDFKDTFLEFCRITVEKYKETGEVVDFLGNKNLSVITKDGVSRITILDPHKVHNKNKPLDPERRKREENQLAYLESFL